MSGRQYTGLGFSAIYADFVLMINFKALQFFPDELIPAVNAHDVLIWMEFLNDLDKLCLFLALLLSFLFLALLELLNFMIDGLQPC